MSEESTPSEARDADGKAANVETFLVVVAGLANNPVNVYLAKGTLAQVKQAAQHQFFPVHLYRLKAASKQDVNAWNGTRLESCGYNQPTNAFDQHINAAANEFVTTDPEGVERLITRAIEILERRRDTRFHDTLTNEGV